MVVDGTPRTVERRARERGACDGNGTPISVGRTAFGSALPRRRVVESPQHEYWPSTYK
jgi:hypothetical protein